MGGRMSIVRIIVGVVLICVGLQVSLIGFVGVVLGGFVTEGAWKFVLAGLAGLAMALLGLVVFHNGIDIKGSPKQEKGGVPLKRCKHCGSHLMGNPSTCKYCGADVK